MKLTYRYLRYALRRNLSLSHWNRQLLLWGGAITVGLASALFALGSDLAFHGFRQLLAYTDYLPLLLTPLGLVAITWVTRRYFPGAQGSGIPQAIASLQAGKGENPLRDSLLSIRTATGKVVLSMAGLLCGASIGREGPTVHIGAAIMYSFGRFARLPRHLLTHSLIIAGGAAGVAAAFNTPLAGIVFAIEEMARSFEERTSGTLLTVVVLAGITAMALLGNYTYFGTTSASLVTPSDWLLVPLCGVLGGLCGGGFARALVSGSRRIAPLLQTSPLLIPALCGVIVALAGLGSGGLIYGTGYDEARLVMSGSGQLDLDYPLLKMVATLASYFSGIPGGIFAPSLATGAGFGSALAGWLSGVDPQAVILLMMVSYFTGVVQTPITAFVIVMEMTDSHDMVLPLMATAFIAYGVSKLVNHKPIYRTLALGFIAAMNAADEKANNNRN